MAEQTPIQQWTGKTAQIAQLGRRIVTISDEAQRIFDANAIGATIAALQPGEVLPDTTMTKEQAVEFITMWTAVNTTLETPLESLGGQTPAMILFKA